ncbi:MAG: DJ-1/PfpI family protein [Candidatus Hydrothermarchaeales archaeon]
MNEKKILMVIAPRNFRDEEILRPKKIFEDSGAEVVVASTSTGTAMGMLGARIDPDISLDQVDAKDYDAIVVVGGGGSKQYLWDNALLQDIVREAHGEGKVVAAICISPVVLAKAGLLKGKEATVFPSSDTHRELEKNGAIISSQETVVSGNIVTGRGPESAEEFGYRVIETLR